MPTISQYIEALTNPEGVFRTIGTPVAELDCYRNIKVCAGRNSVVFPVMDAGGRRCALKCYLKRPQYPVEVYNYINSHPSPLLCRAKWLEGEVYLFDEHGQGEWCDAVLGDWVEGETLENVLRRAAGAGDKAIIAELSENFEKVACVLLSEPWAHGDLKPENIIVGDDLRMTLIDYDALYIPELAGRRTEEIGTPAYQHPARGSEMYDKHVDDYPIALIAASLRALAYDPSLYSRYNRGDNIIFDPAQLAAGRCELRASLLEQWDRLGDSRAYRLTALLGSPTPQIDSLTEIFSDTEYGCENLSLVCRAGLWGYADSSGREVIAAQYAEAFEFSEGLAAVSLERCWHFIDSGNRVRIDCAGWQQVKPFHSGFAAVKSGGAWGYIDRDGKWLVEPRFDIAYNFRGSRAQAQRGEERVEISDVGEIKTKKRDNE